MEKQLIIKFEGTLAKGNKISIRTLSHTLPHFQRAIDKIIMYETRDSVGKGATLHQIHYPVADLYLEEIVEGSIILPLIGNLLTGATARFNTFLSEPYREAENTIDSKISTFDTRVETVRTQLASGLVKPISHQSLIDREKVAQTDYAQAAFLNDINNMLAPLRSRSCAEDQITIHNADPRHPATFVFNQNKSKAFAKVVRAQRLAHPVSYSGKLEGLVNRGGTGFPYVVKFICSSTDKEMKLLVASESDALELNKYNIGNTEIDIIACPLSVYGTFDPLSGDIVFIAFRK
ncbi:hypothetical protein HX871_15150 [Pseudomonas reactans]|uniref:Uncharacterized protein n=1 Tax=Pseudomonas reactans TaxID=117680 RepID=A0ABX2QVC5_9PSED|nr:hypothetical protein [Pseudomonas reactans]NWA42615.1 hypothetical protein [Pseudomonas reactans]NWC85487.1 hypothetical protein [Pseudomonas reactans]NWD29510.1 hypothetical protein [Pseudomonas reactans]NWD95767.1 hypothetical protein [Pseudomonas reactans]